MDARRGLGIRGEQAAADFYRRAGFDVVARNYRCSGGEIDLVVARPGLTVFCEVKLRTSDAFGLPAEGLRRTQMVRIRAASREWLAANRRAGGALRFDVVSVIVRGSSLELTHIPGAF